MRRTSIGSDWFLSVADRSNRYTPNEVWMLFHQSSAAIVYDIYYCMSDVIWRRPKLPAVAYSRCRIMCVFFGPARFPLPDDWEDPI